MRSNIFILITILSVTFLFVGCSTTETPTNSNNSTNANSNAANTNSNNPFGTTKTPEAAMNNNAPTLSPVVSGYYDALRKKDEAGVKKYLSQSALKYWEDEMKSEKATSLIAILTDNESPVEDKREVRNENIQGDSAIAEIKGGAYPVWTKYKFVRENGEWKFASPKDSPELEGVPKTAPNVG